MHPFPPDPPFWETLNGALTIQLTLTAILLGGVGVWLLLDLHKPKKSDAAIWCAAGVVLSISCLVLSSLSDAPRQITSMMLPLEWAATVFGAWWSWLRLHDKDDARQTVVSIVALIVVGLILLPCLLPSLAPPAEATHRTQCRDNLHQLGIAMHNYHDDFDQLPTRAEGQPPASWRVQLLPYVDGQPIHARYDFASAWDSDANLAIARTPWPAYMCPSVPEKFTQRDGMYFTSYALAYGPDAIWQDGEVPALNRDDLPDGQSHTIMLFEACGQEIVWTEPRDIDLAATPLGMNLPGAAVGQSQGVFSGYHRDAVHVLIADGAVRALSTEIDSKILKALLTANGGEEVGEF